MEAHPTIDDISNLCASDGAVFLNEFKMAMEIKYGSMSDNAVGLLMATGMGITTLLPNGIKITPMDIAIQQSLGMTPDEILDGMRKLGEKPGAKPVLDP